MKKNSSFRNYCMLFMLWFCIIPIQAQEEAWEQMNGPYGGYISHMITGKNGTVCASAGSGGLYVSNDKGAHWSEKLSRIIYSLAVSRNGTLYAGGDSLYISTDDGNTWNSQAHDGNIVVIAVDSSNRIYIGGRVTERSDDAGASWTRLGIGTEYLQCLAAGPAGVLYAGFQDSSVYRSLDYGASWAEMNSGLTYKSPIRSFAFTKSGYVLFSTLYGYLFRAKINKDIWQMLSRDCYGVLATDSSGNIYHGSGNAGIYKSADDGLTWKTVNDGLVSRYVGPIATASEGIIYAGTDGMGVFRSSNMGLSWEETNEGLDNLMVTIMNGNSKGDIFTGSWGGGMQKSSDGGQTWTRFADKIANFWISEIEIDPFDRIFMLSDTFFISENDGIDWRLFPGAFPFAFSKDGDLLASTGNEVMKCDSSFEKWDTLYKGTNIKDIAINDSNYIFAIENGGVQISRDFGKTWSRTEVQTGNLFNLHISKSGSLFAIAYNKLIRSDDNGTTWIDLVIGQLNLSEFKSITSDNNGCIYLATRRDGIYRSCDNGNSWSPFNNGLKRLHVNCVYIDHEGYLYAGTYEDYYYKKSAAEGNKMNPSLNNFNSIESNVSEVISGSYLFRIKTGGANSVKISKSGSQDFTLEQNFPNPFSTTSTIRFKLAQTENVSLKIYNSLGQIVLTPLNGRKEAGFHEVVVNATEMSAGVYFYRLQTQKGILEKKFIVVR